MVVMNKLEEPAGGSIQFEFHYSTLNDIPSATSLSTGDQLVNVEFKENAGSARTISIKNNEGLLIACLPVHPGQVSCTT